MKNQLRIANEEEGAKGQRQKGQREEKRRVWTGYTGITR
jgi:hypothetical protein